MKSSYSPGEIILVNLGEVNEVKGHEQAKTRPCVVIKTFERFKLVIVLPLTSSAILEQHYTIVPISKGTAGLTIDSYVLCHQIRTIAFDRIIKSIGTLGERDFLKIRSVLLDTLT